MVDWPIVQKLARCFPNSFINGNGEFIAHLRSNQYFILHDCETELDVQCKVIEWFSRPACKTQFYTTSRKNKEFQQFMLNGLNNFLGTSFTGEDMEEVYTYLGNAIRHDLTVEFVQSGYDMKILMERESK